MDTRGPGPPLFWYIVTVLIQFAMFLQGGFSFEPHLAELLNAYSWKDRLGKESPIEIPDIKVDIRL